VLGIVGQSGGAIRVRSEVGRGSEFVMFLPRHAPESASAADGAPGPAEGGGETILVVEDDERLRAMLRRTLAAHGYRVLEAGAPGEARAVVAHRPPPALLVTDVILPEGNGVDLARELARRWPHVPVVFISGYAGDHLSALEPLPPGARFLPKPFTPEALLAEVREALRREARALRTSA
jgi:DNA-binding response OmpR family regulator